MTTPSSVALLPALVALEQSIVLVDGLPVLPADAVTRAEHDLRDGGDHATAALQLVALAHKWQRAARADASGVTLPLAVLAAVLVGDATAVARALGVDDVDAARIARNAEQLGMARLLKPVGADGKSGLSPFELLLKR